MTVFATWLATSHPSVDLGAVEKGGGEVLLLAIADCRRPGDAGDDSDDGDDGDNQWPKHEVLFFWAFADILSLMTLLVNDCVIIDYIWSALPSTWQEVDMKHPLDQRSGQSPAGNNHFH